MPLHVHPLPKDTFFEDILSGYINAMNLSGKEIPEQVYQQALSDYYAFLAEMNDPASLPDSWNEDGDFCDPRYWKD